MYVNLKQLNKKIQLTDLTLTLENIIQKIKLKYGINIETKSVFLLNEELLENLNQPLSELSLKPTSKLDIYFSQQAQIQFKNEKPSDDFELEIDLWSKGDSLIQIIKKKFLSPKDYPIQINFQDRNIDLNQTLIQQNIGNNSILNYQIQIIIDVEYQNYGKQFTFNSFQTVQSFKQHIIDQYNILQGMDFVLKYQGQTLQSSEIFFNNYEPKISLQIVKSDQKVDLNGESTFKSEELKNQTDSNYFTLELYQEKQLRILLIDSESLQKVQEFEQITDLINYIKNQELENEKFSFHKQIIVPNLQLSIEGDDEVIYFSRKFKVIFQTQGEQIHSIWFQNNATLEQIKKDFKQQYLQQECEIQFYYKDTLLDKEHQNINQYIDGDFKVNIEVRSKKISYKLEVDNIKLENVLFIQVHETIESLKIKISQHLGKLNSQITLFYDGVELLNKDLKIIQLGIKEDMEFEVQL